FFREGDHSYRLFPPTVRRPIDCYSHDTTGKTPSAIQKSREKSSPRRKNKSLCENRKQPYIPSRPALTTEGVSRSLRHVARDAMDAPLTAKRAADARTVKPCGPGTSTLVSSSLRCDFGLAAETQRSADDGG